MRLRIVQLYLARCARLEQIDNSISFWCKVRNSVEATKALLLSGRGLGSLNEWRSHALTRKHGKQCGHADSTGSLKECTAIELVLNIESWVHGYSLVSVSSRLSSVLAVRV